MEASMAQVLKARSYFERAPREALTDVAALAGMCLLVFAGFTLPAFF
jgi:hypothetical protein